jgi:hypothetical protein
MKIILNNGNSLQDATSNNRLHILLRLVLKNM